MRKSITGPIALSRRRDISSSAWRSTALALMVSALMFFAGGDIDARGGQKWFTAWSTSHGQRFTTPALSGSSVRMRVRPTISGNSVRLKLENTLGQAPVVFSNVYLGAMQSGAAVVPKANRQLTFDGSPGLRLTPYSLLPTPD